MIIPFQWILIFPCYSDKFLRKYNSFLCHLLYLPLAALFTGVFAALAILCVPLAYVAQTLRLLARVGTSEGAGQRAYAFVQFLILGPILLLTSVPIDCMVFFYNLYTEPPAGKQDTAHVPLTESDIDILEECLDLALSEKRH